MSSTTWHFGFTERSRPTATIVALPAGAAVVRELIAEAGRASGEIGLKLSEKQPKQLLGSRQLDRKPSRVIARFQRETIFPDSTEVDEFIETRNWLLIPVVQCLRIVQDKFGTGTPVRLAVVRDPEADGISLVAYVLARLSVSKGIGLIDAIEDEWYCAQPQNVQRSFSICFRPQ